MTRQPATTCRALRDFALVAAASLAAASIWATGLPEEGYLVDAEMWVGEVADPQNKWPKDGWFQILATEQAVEVRPVQATAVDDVRPDAFFFRMPGTPLKAGARPAYRYLAAVQHPHLGQEYELAMGRTRFSLRVDAGPRGMVYAIGYGGQAYSYVLGTPQAVYTGLRTVADLDGDARPDFLVQVDDATFLLLSTRAQPGANVPTAQLWTTFAGC